MSDWSTLKKVLVFGGGGLLALIILAGIFGESPKKTATATSTKTVATKKPTTLKEKASAFSACMMIGPSWTWQTDVPEQGRSKKWDKVNHRSVVYNGKVIALPAGVALYKGTEQYWVALWVADDQLAAKQAASQLGDPKQEEALTGYNAQNVENYGLWEADKGSGTLSSTSDPTDADINKLPMNAATQLGNQAASCSKKLGI